MEIAPPALPPVPLRRFPLRHEVSSHRFKVSFYSYGLKSVGHEQRARILYSSHLFAFRSNRNSHRDAQAQKQFIWEEAQKNNLTMPRETSRKHSIHNTATVSLFYIYKKNNKILKINMLLLLHIDTNKQVNSEEETTRPNKGALKGCRLLSKLKKTVVRVWVRTPSCWDAICVLWTNGPKSPRLKCSVLTPNHRCVHRQRHVTTLTRTNTRTQTHRCTLNLYDSPHKRGG